NECVHHQQFVEMVEGVGVRLNRPDLPFGGLEFSDQTHRLLMVILQKLCSSHTILPRKIEDLLIADCGLRIANCGLIVGALSHARGGMVKAGFSDSINPQSAIRNPKILNTRSSIYILLTYRSASTMPDGARGGSSRRSRCMECNLIALKQCMTYV